MSRKYRQHGYQDSGPKETQPERRPPQSDGLSTEERLQRKSLRHATAREANEVIRCHQCGRHVQNSGAITRDTRCPDCSAELHCCRTCRHFDSAARWQCRAEITQAVGDKGKGNDCPQYMARLVLDATGRRSDSTAARDPSGPKAQFESLFKR
jgi:DNA-directed RNA polymerase subunit RPC12/RpoP